MKGRGQWTGPAQLEWGGSGHVAGSRAEEGQGRGPGGSARSRTREVRRHSCVPDGAGAVPEALWQAVIWNGRASDSEARQGSRPCPGGGWYEEQGRRGPGQSGCVVEPGRAQPCSSARRKGVATYCTGERVPQTSRRCCDGWSDSRFAQGTASPKPSCVSGVEEQSRLGLGGRSLSI